MNAKELGEKYIMFTDHESALADLRGKLNDALGATHGYMQALAAVEQKHQTLLSGLGALAGEWELEEYKNIKAGADGGQSALSGEECAQQLRERIRTLASEAKK